MAGQLVPAAVNRSTVGGPPVDRPDRGPAAPKVVAERAGLRTASSRTWELSDGALRVEVFPAPVHFWDGRGGWRPIDATLVPPDAAGGAGGWRNAAGGHRLELPADLGSGAVRLAEGDAWVAFRLQGADASAGAVDAATTAVYRDVLAGVTARYTTTLSRVKEDLVLADRSAPTSFDFAVELSAGLTAQTDGEGGVAFVDPAGVVRFRFTPPFMVDSAAVPARSDAVSMTVTQTSPLVISMAADPGWLADPARVWPVTIDPILTAEGLDGDCGFSSDTPTSKNCYGDSFQVGSDSHRERRAVLRYDLTGLIDEPVTVARALVQLHRPATDPDTATGGIGVHEVTEAWDEGGATWQTRLATWQTRLTGVDWATPGGTHDPERVFRTGVKAPGSWTNFWFSDLAQRWLDDPASNHGILLKPADGSGQYTFASSEHPDPALWPKLIVEIYRLTGSRDLYGHETVTLGERRVADVNVATGNLSLAETDVTIAGTGLDASVTRQFNSQYNTTYDAGVRWALTPGTASRLHRYGDGSIGVLAGTSCGSATWETAPTAPPAGWTPPWSATPTTPTP